MEIRDLALLDISNVLLNLDKLEANYKAVGARLGSNVRLNLDTTQADAKLRELETRLTGIDAKAGSARVGLAGPSLIAPRLDPAAETATEASVKSLAGRLQSLLTLTVRLRTQGADPVTELVSTIMLAVKAIEDLGVALSGAGKIVTQFRTETASISTPVQAVATAIKQLALEQKNGVIGASELISSMTALRGRVIELGAAAEFGSKDAVVLGQAYRTASAALGEAALKSSPLAASIESIRVRASGLRAAFQTGAIGQAEFLAGARALIAESKALNVTLEGDAVAFRNLQVAVRPAVAAIDSLEGRLSRLGLASQVGLALGRTQQLVGGLASSLAFLPGPLGLIAVYAQTATAGLQGLSVAELAAAAPAIALGIALVGVVGSFGLGVVEAAKFEREMDSISSVGNLTAAEMEILTRRIQDLSVALPVSQEALAGVARNAELLGVRGAKDIGDFTEVVAKLGLSSREASGAVPDLAELGTTVAQFLNQTGSSAATYSKDIVSVAASLAAVDKATESTLPKTLAIASNLAKTGVSAGLTREQIIGLAGAYAGLKVAPEAAGTAQFNILRKIEGAANSGGVALERFAKYTGMTTEEFARLGKENPGEAYLALARGIGESGAKGAAFTQILDDLNIKNVRSIGLLGVGSTGFRNLARGVEVANQATANKAALDERAAAATANLKDDLVRLKDAVIVFTENIGTPLLEPLDKGVKQLTGLFNGSKHLGEYLPVLAAAIGTVTGAYVLQSDALKGLLELEALQNLASLKLAASKGLSAIGTSLRNLPGLLKGAGSATSKLDATLGAGFGGGGGFLTFLKGLAAIPVSAVAALTGIALLAGGIAIYGAKIAADTRATYDSINDNADKAQTALFEKARSLAAQGPLGKLKAAQVLTISLRYNYENSDAQNASLDKRLAGLKSQIASQELVDTANKKNAVSGQEVVKATDAQVGKYQELEDKLVAVSEKYGQDKLTPFQTGVVAARKELDALNKSIQTALDKGQLTEAQGKGLQGQASALATRAVSDLTRRQLEEDATALRGHERDIQNGLTGLIEDARVKRQATLDQEIKDLGEKYGPAIKAALQNAQTAPAGQRGSFLREAGQLQQDQAREVVVAQQKANVDLEQIDRDRASKVRVGQQALLAEQQKSLVARTALLVSEQQEAVTAAGESSAAQLEATRRYAPLILAAKGQELQARSQAERLQAKTDLDNGLHDAETAGAARGQLELGARQLYLERIRNINQAAQTDQDAARLSSVKAEQEAEARVVKDYADRQLADVSQLSGSQLAGLLSQYRAAVAVAAGEGNAPLTAAYKAVVDQIVKLQQATVNSFRATVEETEKTITDLSKKLRDAQPVSEKVQGQRQARQPFDDVIRSGQEAISKLRTEFGKLSPADQTGARLQRFLADTQTLEGQVRQARADSDTASLRAEASYNAKRVTEANMATTSIRQGELALAQSRFQLAEKQARTDAEQVAARQNLIGLAAKDLHASEEALARLPGERAAALAGAGTPEERQRVANTYTERSLSAQNDLVGKRAALYDAVQSRVQLEVDQQARRLSLEQARAKVRESQVPELERGLIIAQDDVKLSEQALANAERALALSRSKGAGASDLSTRQLAVETARVDLASKLEAQQKTQAAFTIDNSAQALALEDARAKVLEASVPLRQRALVTAQQDVQSGETALRNAQEALGLSRGRADESSREAAVQTAQADLLGKREALESAITAEVDRRVATQQLELDFSQARQRANAQISGAANDAVESARLDLQLTGQNLEANRRQQALLLQRKDSQDALLGLQKTEAELIGTQTGQQRALTQAIRDRQVLLESIVLSERGLDDGSGARLQGTALAVRTLAEARDDLGATERRYALALADVGREQNQTTLGAFKTATDDLTGKTNAQRQAVQGLADSYRSQISEMDGVRSATERLATVVRGPDTGKIGQGDVNAELDRLKAIQSRRDDALGRVQEAITSGDEKRIQSATTDLASQEDRYKKQFERVAKGTGIQLSLTNEGQVADTLKRLEQLGVTYDQLSPELQKRADAADLEASSADVLKGAMDSFAGTVDRLLAGLKSGLSGPQNVQGLSGPTTYSIDGQSFNSLAEAEAYHQSLYRGSRLATPSLPPPTTGTTNARGGDTINIQITLDGQPVPTPDEFRQIARREIAGAIQDARRDKAWKPGC